MKKWIVILFIMLVSVTVICAGYAESDTSVTVPTVDNLKKFDIPDNEALRLIRDMKTGWVLGNTFDAWNNGWFTGKEPEMETYWCQAKTTQELIRAIKDAGFNVIRVPVSWHDHVDENYIINPVWLNRVKEVVGWILDEGMYAIVNVHHDNSEDFFYPDTAHYEQSEKYLTAIWKQMAEAFSECDEHLVLESMNEPRLVGTDFEWDLNEAMPACRDAADCINRLNQKFVDTVRAAGGNNATRYLLVPGYCASPKGVLSSLFRMPQDTEENKIILEVHAYTPYDFALNAAPRSQTEFSIENSNQISDIATFMNSLYNRFVVNGIPVLIDEYGALNKKGNLQSRVDFTAYYIASASARGMTCCWWDNHAFSGNGEQFGLIDRKAIKWRYPEIVDAIMQNCLYNRE